MIDWKSKNEATGVPSLSKVKTPSPTKMALPTSTNNAV